MADAGRHEEATWRRIPNHYGMFMMGGWGVEQRDANVFWELQVSSRICCNPFPCFSFLVLRLCSSIGLKGLGADLTLSHTHTVVKPRRHGSAKKPSSHSRHESQVDRLSSRFMGLRSKLRDPL